MAEQGICVRTFELVMKWTSSTLFLFIYFLDWLEMEALTSWLTSPTTTPNSSMIITWFGGQLWTVGLLSSLISRYVFPFKYKPCVGFSSGSPFMCVHHSLHLCFSLFLSLSFIEHSKQRGILNRILNNGVNMVDCSLTWRELEIKQLIWSKARDRLVPLWPIQSTFGYKDIVYNGMKTESSVSLSPSDIHCMKAIAYWPKVQL